MSHGSAHVLLIEDNPGDADLVRQRLDQPAQKAAERVPEMAKDVPGALRDVDQQFQSN